MIFLKKKKWNKAPGIQKAARGLTIHELKTMQHKKGAIALSIGSSMV